MAHQIVVFATLGFALLMFAWGRLRYDIVAMLCLIAVTVTGVVPASEALAWFGHPAVITVAAVLVISRAILNSGLADILSRHTARLGKSVLMPRRRVAQLRRQIAEEVGQQWCRLTTGIPDAIRGVHRATPGVLGPWECPLHPLALSAVVLDSRGLSWRLPMPRGPFWSAGRGDLPPAARVMVGSALY